MRTLGLVAATILWGPVLLGSCIHTDDRQVNETARARAAVDRATAVGRQVPAELIRYRQIASIRTGLDRSAGLAVGPNDAVCVAGDQEVRVFARNGRVQRTLALDDTPTCVGVDKDGTIFVGYKTTVTMHKLDGEILAAWTVGGKHPHVTCVTPAGNNVWVADAGDRVVLRYDRTGRLIGRIGERDEARKVPGLIVPSPHLDVAVGPNGLLLVNNPGRLALETYTQDGKLVSYFQRSSMAVDGFCGCCNPTDLALLPDGRVVTSEKGIPRIKVLKTDGTLDCVVAAPESFSAASAALDVAVSRTGEILVLDPRARLVRIFAEEGRP